MATTPLLVRLTSLHKLPADLHSAVADIGKDEPEIGAAFVHVILTSNTESHRIAAMKELPRLKHESVPAAVAALHRSIKREKTATARTAALNAMADFGKAARSEIGFLKQHAAKVAGNEKFTAEAAVAAIEEAVKAAANVKP